MEATSAFVETGGHSQLKHYFTDLGGGSGKACGPISRHCEDPNAFGWTFTRPWKFRGKGKMTIPFRIVDYEPIQDTLAFEKMTLDDARWMARLIGQLTETQIVQALVASGFDSVQAKIFTEKLISRRDRMVCDLGLGDNLTLLRPQGMNRKFSYDPAADGLRRSTLADARYVEAPRGEWIVQDGVVVRVAVPQPASFVAGRRGQGQPSRSRLPSRHR